MSTQSCPQGLVLSTWGTRSIPHPTCALRHSTTSTITQQLPSLHASAETPVIIHVLPLLANFAHSVSAFFFNLLNAGDALPVSQRPLLLLLVVGLAAVLIHRVMVQACIQITRYKSKSVPKVVLPDLPDLLTMLAFATAPTCRSWICRSNCDCSPPPAFFAKGIWPIPTNSFLPVLLGQRTYCFQMH